MFSGRRKVQKIVRRFESMCQELESGSVALAREAETERAFADNAMARAEALETDRRRAETLRKGLSSLLDA